MSQSFLFGLKTLNIDSRALVQVENTSPENQPVYIQFDGGVDVNHFFTLPGSQSFVAIVEAKGTLHFSTDVNIKIQVIEPYCRFNYKVINESEIFQLPVAPYSDVNLSDWEQIWNLLPTWTIDSGTIQKDPDTNETALHGLKNIEIGSVRNGVFSGQFKNLNTSHAVRGSLGVRDYFALQFEFSNTCRLLSHPKHHLKSVSSNVGDSHGSTFEITGVDSGFQSWVNFKIEMDGDIISTSVWADGYNPPPSPQSVVDVTQVATISNITPEDMETGHCFLSAQEGTSMNSFYRNLKFTF